MIPTLATADVPVELYPLAFCVGVAGLGGIAALGRQSEYRDSLLHIAQVLTVLSGQRNCTCPVKCDGVVS